MIRKCILLCAALPLSACQTFSFAPPLVETHEKVERHGLDCSTAVAAGGRRVQAIKPTMIGAMDLVNNYVLAYRCAEYDLANGRQYFQVPAFLSAAAGLIGANVLGLSSDAVLMAGVSSATLNAGNSYYAPRDKATLVTTALRAVLCVKSEAAGISYFRVAEKEKPTGGDSLVQGWRNTLGLLDEEEKRLGGAGDGRTLRAEDRARLVENAEHRRKAFAGLLDAQQRLAADVQNDEVYLDAERQYFEMVGAALFSIESILAERLLDAGKADTTETFTRLKELVKQSEEADQKLALTGSRPFESLNEKEKKDRIKLENAKLQPLLQVCVLQARS